MYLNVGPRSPTIHRPQGIRWPLFLKPLFVYLYICLYIYLYVLGKFSNFSPHPPLSPLLLISKIFSVMNKKYTFPEWIPMYWHRTHQTSLTIKNTSRESMPCTMCAWYCGWGDHNYIFITYFHFTARHIWDALAPYCFIIIARLMPIYKMYTIG